MFKRFSTNYMVLLFLIDLGLVQVSLSLAMWLRFVLPVGPELLPGWIPEFVYTPTLFLHVAVGIIWALSFLLGSVYSPRRVIFWFEEFQRIAMSHTVATLCFAGLLYMIKRDLSRLTFLYFFLIVAFSLIGYRAILRSWYRLRRSHGTGFTRVMIVGAGRIGREVAMQLDRQEWSSLEVIGFLDDSKEKQGAFCVGYPILGGLDQACDFVRAQQIDEVILALPLHAHKRMRNVVVLLQELPVHIHVVPDYFDLAFHGAGIETIGGIPLIGLRDPAIDGFQRFAKRLMDLAIAGAGLLFLWPVMIIIALLIKLEDGGPIFYRGPRIGENGRPFHMLKFRSMIVNADKLQMSVNKTDEKSRLIFKQASDPRITRLGRFLRRTSLDELPQLINVLRGEMTLVGPRPELPWLVESYAPWQRKRFAVPQGMTGWWQVNGRSDNPMHLHTDQDLYYIQHYSLWLDIQILWRTIAVVLRGRGAY